MHFVFKPENFVKTNGFFVYSEKGFVPLVTMCFVKKKCFRNETQVIHLCKGQASFFLQILVSVMVLCREKQN